MHTRYFVLPKIMQKKSYPWQWRQVVSFTMWLLMIVNGGMERMWKEEVVTNLRYHTSTCLDWLRKTTEILRIASLLAKSQILIEYISNYFNMQNPRVFHFTKNKYWQKPHTIIRRWQSDFSPGTETRVNLISETSCLFLVQPLTNLNHDHLFIFALFLC
jgi:hypothetical protein